MDDAAIVHVVFLAACGTGGDATGAHRQREFWVQIVVLTSYAVRTLSIVGHETTIGLGIHGLETNDDAVVESQDVVGESLHLSDLLMGCVTTLIALEMEYKSAHARVPYLAEDSTRVDIHGRGQRGVKVQTVVVSETARPGGVLAFGFTRSQEVKSEE